MIPYRGVTKVRAIGPLHLAVTFRGSRREWTVDLAPWIEGVEMLEPLRDPNLFAGVRLLDQGHTLEWVEDEIDMGGDQLWRMAGEQTGELMPTEAFRAWRRRHGLSLTDAAEVLGLSRRMVAYYDSGQRPVPKTVMLATAGYEARREAA